jgi:predicted nucleic acid-binding Zn ribbon protein
MNKTHPQAIKDVVSTILEGLKSREPQYKMGLLQEWRRAVRGNIAKHTKPVAWRGTRLIVNVDSSSYLYELSLRKEKILSRLKKYLGKEKINEIQFRIGET